MEGDVDTAISKVSPGDDSVPQNLFDAMRELMWIHSPEDARDLAISLVENFGGNVVSADESTSSTMPIDLSFGTGTPMLPSASERSVARMLLEQYLPLFVVDVRRMLQLRSEIERHQEHASLDSLTQLSNRRMTGRALGRLLPGESVLLIDLDHFKTINDSLGHQAGDQVLRTFGRAILSTLRGRDFAGRYGGEEFVVVLPTDSEAEPLLERLRKLWLRIRPYEITFSAGIALVGTNVAAALGESDAAMYRAKSAGRDQWMWATSPTRPDSLPLLRSVRGNRTAAEFVA